MNRSCLKRNKVKHNNETKQKIDKLKKNNQHNYHNRLSQSMEPEEDDGKPKAFDKWYQRLDCFHYLTMALHFVHLTIFLVRSHAHSPHGTLWCPCVTLFSCCPRKYHYFAGTFSHPRTVCHFEPHSLSHCLSL